MARATSYSARYCLKAYRQSGQSHVGTDYFTHHPQFPVKGGSAKGGTGKADAALGHFGPSLPDIPQVLCEYKDARSGLDTPQKRGRDYRTPVRQGLDYLAAARRNSPPLAAISPQWAIITDMNEFRLYSANNPRFKSEFGVETIRVCLLYTSPSPRDKRQSRMPSSA